MMLTDEHSSMAMNSIAHAADMAGYRIQTAAAEWERWCVLLRPKLYIDGDQWCALYGEDIQNGVCGFGDSPGEAMYDFDQAFFKKLKESPE